MKSIMQIHHAPQAMMIESDILFLGWRKRRRGDLAFRLQTSTTRDVVAASSVPNLVGVVFLMVLLYHS